jgi:Mrp family chromosome partitioning ATPase/capsular polysaccharide biosynthesis protein
MTISERHQGSSLQDYLRILRRRKWVVLIAAILAPAAAVLISMRQAPAYEASADVLLRHENLAGSVTGIFDTSVREDPARISETQANLASTPAVAERALSLAGLTDITADDALNATSVSANPDADVLTFTVRDGDPSVAEQLATAYAQAYTQYRQELDTGAIVKAREEAEARIAELETAGQEGSPLHQSLVDKVELLSTLETLQTQNAFVIREAETAEQVEPKPVRNGLLAAALGIVLGIGLAFLWETLDTRVRSAGEIQRVLGLPLLGRIPEPPRVFGSENRLVTLGAPRGPQAEAFRVLRTNLEFVNLDRHARTIMITSAVPGEGKSTTAANLAVALARAGRQVALVDLDLRRPSLHLFLDRNREPGLTDVVLGRVPLEEALVRINLTTTAPFNGPEGSNGGRSLSSAGLEFLPVGPVPPNAGEFVSTARIGEILEELRDLADVVLIDTPPLLGVGDALTVSARVDGLILVSRLKTLRRPVLQELHRVLDASPAAKLGFVLAGAEGDEDYGDSGYYHYAARPRGETERVG